MKCFQAESPLEATRNISGAGGLKCDQIKALKVLSIHGQCKIGNG
jgi:hypothetical protein